MSEAELPLALRIERLSRFVERLGAIISDDVKVYVEIYWVNIQDSSLGGQDSILKSWPEAEVAVMILNETEILYAHLKSEYWPQLGQARMEYRVVSTADGLELEFRLP